MKNKNKLKLETSPYLLQHADNPVNWHSWGEEPFEAAAKENKPVFISIGYSTCHWCHVMAHESFEDNEVAKILNEKFICIKVDREEHPEIDNYYMQACQLMTGRGGWPLSVFTGQDKKPFYAGTYFPKNSARGRMGFIDLLLKINEVWGSDYSSIQKSIKEIDDILIEQNRVQKGSGFNESVFKKAFDYFSSSFDAEYGGFGESPKFPSPHNLLFLLRYRHHYKEEKALEIVETTVKQICSGGIFDHAGGGFHRYSTDRYWKVPHFEKMLYDQAMMVLLLSNLYRITGSYFYKYYLEAAVEFVLNEMKSPDGAFYSAYDADSEGEEGKFYVWKYEELESILSGDEIGFLEKYYGVEKNGNYSEEHSGIKPGNNILFFNLKYISDFENIAAQFIPLRKKLMQARKLREFPLLDNKVLTDWNGLMIYSLVSASQALNNREYLRAAEKAYSYILRTHFDDDVLYHSSVGEKINRNSILDDYAFCGMAAEFLFENTGDAVYLNDAVKIAGIVKQRFYDPEKKLFKLSDSAVGFEGVTLFDNAYPSGNSAAFFFLSRLSAILKNDSFSTVLNPLFDGLPEAAAKYPSGAAFLLQTLFDSNFGIKQGILVGGSINTPPGVLTPLKGLYEPDKVIIRVNSENIKELSEVNPFYEAYSKPLSEIDAGKRPPFLINCDKNGCSSPIYPE